MDPQNPRENPGMAAHTCYSSDGGQGQKDSSYSLLASLANQ